jgi:hypothetical protein
MPSPDSTTHSDIIVTENVIPNEDEDEVEDDDEIDDEDEDEQRIMELESYQRFIAKWNRFQQICDQHNVMTRANYSCCNNCGVSEICGEHDEPDNQRYDAYLFYHCQENDRVFAQLESNTQPVHILLNWGYFDDDTQENNYSQLAKRVADCATTAECVLEYTNYDTKLELII